VAGRPPYPQRDPEPAGGRNPQRIVHTHLRRALAGGKGRGGGPVRRGRPGDSPGGGLCGGVDRNGPGPLPRGHPLPQMGSGEASTHGLPGPDPLSHDRYPGHIVMGPGDPQQPSAVLRLLRGSRRVECCHHRNHGSLRLLPGLGGRGPPSGPADGHGLGGPGWGRPCSSWSSCPGCYRS
jgi:hypothetical protein